MLFIPCLLILNENNNLFINLIGFIYIISLFAFSYTKIGKKLLIKLYRTNIEINDEIFDNK